MQQFEAAVAIRFSHAQIDPQVESLDDAAVVVLAGLEMENGSYGICDSCGGEIPLKRLEAKPSVSLCHDCQTEHEADNRTATTHG